MVYGSIEQIRELFPKYFYLRTLKYGKSIDIYQNLKKLFAGYPILNQYVYSIYIIISFFLLL